jgi:hypothetical protein
VTVKKKLLKLFFIEEPFSQYFIQIKANSAKIQLDLAKNELQESNEQVKETVG